MKFPARFSLAQLRACWSADAEPIRSKPARRTRRPLPVDFGPGNRNLLDVCDFVQGPHYRRHASRFVAWIHERFRSGQMNTTARRIRVVKRRQRNSEGRPVMRVLVVAVG